jgi:hypothetical protein
VDVKLVALLALACSGNKTTPKAVHEDARAGSAHAVSDAPVPIDPNAKGDVQIRVEWKDVPTDARAAPGRTACGTARPAAVVPTVLWGIPDVFVAIDAPAPPSTSTTPSTIGLRECVLGPRAVIAHGTVMIASGMEAPAKLTVQRAGQLPLGGAVKEDKPRELYLPIAGHEVEVALDAGAIYRVAAGDEAAWIVATDHPFVGVTETSGNLVMRNVPAGPHAVTAWLPPRSGQPARIAKGTVNVAPGALTDVTLDITKP